MSESSIIEQAAKSVVVPTGIKPTGKDVVEALLALEKKARSEKVKYSFDRLIGCWRLSFITGTKKTRAKAGIILGAGRYLPQLVKIQITYSLASEQIQPQNFTAGEVKNRVTFGAIDLLVSGPTKFLPKKNILVFDFTKINVRFLGVTLYSGYIRGGELKEKQFYDRSVSQQAFFTYFFISENAIAARGRGGGLAIWGRQNN